MNHVVDVGRPVSGDVIELILEDHRRFEDLLRQLRDATSDRAAVLDALATVLVAHAEAEEKHVYPKLKRRSAVGAHEAEHGEEEHAEGHEALLAVLDTEGDRHRRVRRRGGEAVGRDRRHLVEEELTILDPARAELGSRAKADLGDAFVTERNRQIDAHCGTLTQRPGPGLGQPPRGQTRRRLTCLRPGS